MHIFKNICNEIFFINLYEKEDIGNLGLAVVLAQCAPGSGPTNMRARRNCSRFHEYIMKVLFQRIL